MAVTPGRYNGYGPRPKGAGSARKFIEPLPAFWTRQMARADKHLAEPFKGVTTDGRIVPGLFPLKASGVFTQPIAQAGNRFVDSLSATQRATALHPADSVNWRRWCNWEQFTFRHGVSFEDMNAAQREAALALLRESLSARGFETARNVMKLNHTLAEITGNREWLGEWIYFLCIFGTPSMDQPWGWQLDGHHLNINYFVLGDQVVMTPGFWGAEPTIADRGDYAGLREFEAEERHGLALINALTPEQRKQAILYETMISTELPPERNDANNGRQQSVAFQDNAVLPYEGICADRMTPGQRGLLVDLIEVYTSHLRNGHARVWMEEVKRHLPETHFSWIGGYGPEDTFYYRIHSPVLLVEFDMHKGVFLDNDEPEKFHVHITLRTPNGNDYGKDLLRQHLAADHHIARP